MLLAEDVTSVSTPFPNSFRHRLSSADACAPCLKGSAPLLRNWPCIPACFSISNREKTSLLFCHHLSSFRGRFAACLQVCFEINHRKTCRMGALANLLAVGLNSNGPLLCPAVSLSSADPLLHRGRNNPTHQHRMGAEQLESRRTRTCGSCWTTRCP